MSEAGQGAGTGVALDEVAISGSHRDQDGLQQSSPKGSDRSAAIEAHLPITTASNEQLEHLNVASHPSTSMATAMDMLHDTGRRSNGSVQRVHPADAVLTDYTDSRAGPSAAGVPQRQSSGAMSQRPAGLSHRYSSSGQGAVSPDFADASAVSTPASEDIKRLVITDSTPTSQDSTMDSSNGMESENDSDYMWESRSDRRDATMVNRGAPDRNMETSAATQTGDVLVERPGAGLKPLPLVEMAQSHSVSPQILADIESQVAATASRTMQPLLASGLTGQYTNGSLPAQVARGGSPRTPARTPSYRQSPSASSYTSLTAEQDDASSYYLARSSGEHARHLGPSTIKSRTRPSPEYNGYDKRKKTNWSQEHLAILPDGSVGSATVSAAQRQASRALPSTSVTDRSPISDSQRGASRQTQEIDDGASRMLSHSHGYNDDEHASKASRHHREHPADAERYSERVGDDRAAEAAFDRRTTPAPNGTRSTPDTLVQTQTQGADSPATASQSASQSRHNVNHEARLRPDVMSRQDSSSSQHQGNGTFSKSDRERSTNRKQLGEWTLGKTLGAGSMGKVKLGVSNKDGHKVG